jgi:hypothetical protein
MDVPQPFFIIEKFIAKQKRVIIIIKAERKKIVA